MIQKFVENLNLNSILLFIVSKDYYHRYQLQYLLETLSENTVKIVVLDTDNANNYGKNYQILQCKEYIDLDKPVLIASCTQLLEWDSNAFLYSLANPAVNGGILTFQNAHPRYSYVNLDSSGWVFDVAIKKPISTIATAGVYYWKRGFNLIKYSAIAVAKNMDSNNKQGFLLAFQEGVNEGMRIKSFQCHRMWELSTPKDLDYFHLVCK